MFRILFQAFLLCVILCLLSINVFAQKKNVAGKTLKATKKVTFIVIKNSAKYTYKATKFTTSKVAKPIIIKSAPKAGGVILKTSGAVIKKTYPFSKKLFIKYVKYKFFP